MKAKKISIPVLAGTVLGVKVYRGYAPLSAISQISKPDIYDQKKNPTGTQRDLSLKHAKDAYDYVRGRTLAYWPEVFLCVRNSSVVNFKPTKPNSTVGTLTIDLPCIKASNAICISRTDGNHRLHYADGHDLELPELDQSVSFCLAYGLTLEEEIALFRDINNNQKRMNTSHLDNIQTRLTEEQVLMTKDPALFIAQQLSRSQGSPLLSWIYEGGVKQKGSMIPLRTLKTGIEYMLSRPTKLRDLKSAEAQYKVIRNYFSAVKEWIPDAWENPQDYLALRGAGLWGLCFLGAEVIHRTLIKGSFDTADMTTILRSGKKWDWTNKGTFAGYSGRAGALKISEKVSEDFADTSGISAKELFHRIMKS